jgi:outer membrane protein OmpA-like peptidoglycan-associated protein
MKEKSAMQIEIAGHTDAMGPEPYNLKLSEKRAKSVVKYLVDEGVAQTRIAVLFLGEGKPIAPNETEAGRKKNRRVEFKILKI